MDCGEDWLTSGACSGMSPDLFHPADGNCRAAKRVCRTCDVQLTCLVYALTTKPCVGCWGGATERQRRKMKDIEEVKKWGPLQLEFLCDNTYKIPSIHAVQESLNVEYDGGTYGDS